jgi:hypothetical protein
MKTYLEQIQIKKSKIKKNMVKPWLNVKNKGGKDKKKCLNISKNKENKFIKIFVKI